MSQSIEWAHTTGPVYVAGGDEVLSDGNTANDAPGDGFIAVVFEQCAIYGTPQALMDTFASAMVSIREYVEEHSDEVPC